MPRIDSFLKLGLAQGCSDVHLAVGVPPMLRMHGDLLPIKFRELADTELESYVMEILSDSQKDAFYDGNDLDFSYVADEGGRFRVNLFRKDSGIGAVFRHIPNEVPTLDKLNVPDVIRQFCDYHQGMVLVTGSTGTGKSTTLAAMIDHLNTKPQPQHHQPRGSDRVRSPQQEEPGNSARAWYAPHELCRRRTIGDARGSGRDPRRRDARCRHDIDGDDRSRNGTPRPRYPAYDGCSQDHRPHYRRTARELREQTKSFLAQSLKAVVTQVLAKTPDGRGRRAMMEILVNNRAISKLIMSDQTHQIPSQLQMGRDLGMQLMDQALLEAIQNNEVDPDDAFRYATEKKRFQRFVTDSSILPAIEEPEPVELDTGTIYE